MNKHEKLLQRVLLGTADNNISFNALCGLLIYLGFDERIRGSHHIYRQQGIPELINLQKDGANAKPYQVRQVRNAIVTYGLAGEQDE
jgi:predicted RNA binding protein YcfA (HicA-like mRNA interferase family)